MTIPDKIISRLRKKAGKRGLQLSDKALILDAVTHYLNGDGVGIEYMNTKPVGRSKIG